MYLLCPSERFCVKSQFPETRLLMTFVKLVTLGYSGLKNMVTNSAKNKDFLLNYLVSKLYENRLISEINWQVFFFKLSFYVIHCRCFVKLPILINSKNFVY